MKVLIADDDATGRSLVALLLAKLDLEPVEAEDA